MNAYHDHEHDCWDVAVVGGGLAGLTAAAVAARSGKRVILLERAHTVGGRGATHVREGVHFNLGAHALYLGGEGFRILRDLQVPISGHLPPLGKPLVFLNGQLSALPFSTWELFTSQFLKWSEKWRMARLMANLLQIETAALQATALGVWIDQIAGEGNLAKLLRSLFRLNTYVNDVDHLSAGAAIDQMKIGRKSGVWYLDQGWQTIADGLWNVGQQSGVQTRTGVEVKAVTKVDQQMIVQLSQGESICAKSVVLAVAPTTISQILRLPPDHALVQWSRQNRPVRAACLDVALSRLTRPERLFALGLDSPLYYSVHSAVAKLGPENTHILHVMKYLPYASDSIDDSNMIQQNAVDIDQFQSTRIELENYLETLQPGWTNHIVQQRYLPSMVVTHGIPRAADQGLAGRPGLQLAGYAEVFLAGDWVGTEGQLADAAIASGARAAELATAVAAQTPVAV